MSTSNSANYVLLTRLADEVAARYRAGERPTLQEYLDRYPHLADDLRELFPAMVEIEQVKEDHQEAAGQAAAPPALALQQLGDFRILREVGKGGMGIVYEAEQVSLGRHVALKVLPRNLLLDARAKGRFEREAKAAAKLHHTNIVPVFGVGAQDGLPYYVMQFIHGLGLDEVLDELIRTKDGRVQTDGESRGARKEISAADLARSLRIGAFEPVPNEGSDPGAAVPGAQTVDQLPVASVEPPSPAPPATDGLSDSSARSSSSLVLPGQSADRRASKAKKATYWQSVARIGVQVADALEYAHKQGVVHRDIKPSNLLLDTQGTVWVTDFGLAKADDQQNLTHTGDILGTLRYMPPEAFEGQSDARSDVYSLGLTLYELLAFRPAFMEKERNRLIKQVTHEEPARVSKLNRHVPQDLETIVHKAIDKDPKQRYASAGALAEDLQRFIEDEPIRARRVSQAERLWRWCRRNPAPAAVVGLVCFLAVAGPLAALNQMTLAHREAQARQAADEEAVRAKRAAEEEARARGQLVEELLLRNLTLAERAWFTNNLFRMDPLLEQCPEGRRHLEWHILKRLRYSPKPLTFTGHSHFVAALAFSPPDGKLIASSGIDAVYVWESDTRRIVRTLQTHTGLVLKLAFSPDGTRLATASDDKTVIVWDLATGRPVYAPLQHPVRPTGVAFSPDGQTLASVCIDLNQATPLGEVRLWNAQTGKQRGVMRGHTRLIDDLRFSPDGKYLATPSWDGTVILWDVKAGKARHTIQVHHGPVHRVAFSPDSRQLVTAAGNGKVIPWDVETGAQGRDATDVHSGALMGLAYSPDGRRIVAGGWDSALTFLDARTGQKLLTLHGHRSDIFVVAFSPDGGRLASAGADGVVKVWDGRPFDGVPGPRPLRTLAGHTNVVQRVAFSPDGRRLATSSFDATVHVWEWDTGKQLRTFRGHTSEVWDLAWSPDGRWLASVGGDDRTVRLWDPVTGEQRHEFKEKELPFIASVAFSPDSKLLALAAEREVKLFDVEKGTKVGEMVGHTLAIPQMAFSPDGKQLATASEDRTVRLWDVSTGKEVGRFLGHTLQVAAVAFSPDGKRLATGGWDQEVRLWDVASRKELRTLTGHGNRVWSVAFSPDGTRLVSGGDDTTIRIWDVTTGEELHTWWWHKSSIFHVACRRDSKTGRDYLAVASDDETVSIWELPKE